MTRRAGASDTDSIVDSPEGAVLGELGRPRTAVVDYGPSASGPRHTNAPATTTSHRREVGPEGVEQGLTLGDTTDAHDLHAVRVDRERRGRSHHAQGRGHLGVVRHVVVDVTEAFGPRG